MAVGKEIKEHFSFKSFGSVQRYLKYLKEAGLLEADWNARRGIPVVEEESDSTRAVQIVHDEYSSEIPLLGLVAAGNPIEAIENPTETTFVPKHFLDQKSRHFALSVRGDSLIEDGILEEDIVIIRQQEQAKHEEDVIEPFGDDVRNALNQPAPKLR